MKRLLVIGLFFCGLSSFLAQRHEIGVKIGRSNLVGDIGNSKYIQVLPQTNGDVNNLPVYIGASYKRNFNPYQGIKLTLGYHQIYSSDNYAKEIYKQARNRSFSNDILEGSLTFEYNFFPINNEVRKSMFSPYIFAGISALYYDSPSSIFTISPNTAGAGYRITSESQSSKKKFTGGIPLGIGVKYKFNYNWAVYGEVTFRPTFTDALDYNNIEDTEYTVQYQNVPNVDLPVAQQAFDDFIRANKVGNLNSKDWLNSISVGISYSFGRPPCYCD